MPAAAVMFLGAIVGIGAAFPDVDLHSLTIAVEGAAALVGGALGALGLRSRVDRLESMVDAIHRRLTQWGAPEYVPKEPTPSRVWRRKKPDEKPDDEKPNTPGLPGPKE